MYISDGVTKRDGQPKPHRIMDHKETQKLRIHGLEDKPSLFRLLHLFRVATAKSFCTGRQFLTEKVLLSYTFDRTWYPFQASTEGLLRLFS